MKLGLSIVGGLVALTGIIWFFQGIGLLKGSFMTDQTIWAVIGVICIIVGGGLVLYLNWQKPAAPQA